MITAAMTKKLGRLRRKLQIPSSLTTVFCFLVGLGANLAFAPVNFWPAYLLAMIFLLRMIDRAADSDRPAWQAFQRAGAFAFGLFSFSLHWIYNAFLLVDRDIYGYMAWVVLVLIMLCALLWAISFAVAIKFWRRGVGRLPLFTFAVMCPEAIRGLCGMPWNIPGMVWTPGGAMSQTASLIGIWGLSALTVFLFAAPACVGFAVRREGAVKVHIPLCLLAAAIPGAMWGWGAQRLTKSLQPDDDAPMIRIIEINVPPKEKYTPRNADEILKYYMDLTGPESPNDPNDPDIIIWPEVATPHLLLQSTRALDPVAELLGQRYLIAGSVRTEPATETTHKWYNSLAIISGDSMKYGPLDIYDKHRLVPFGEYIPFAGIVEKTGIASVQYIAKNGFRPGLKPTSMAIGSAAPAFTPLICYESLFSGLTPRTTQRPGWLVNISTDTWFGTFTGPLQHFEHARYRSIEEGLPMARAASGGYSAMIDSFGRVVALADKISVKGHNSLNWTAKTVDVRLPLSLNGTGFASGYDKRFAVLFILFNLWLFVSVRQ